MKKYSIDITITNSTDPEIPEGVYIEAGSFSHSNHNATEHGTTIITWEQLTSFSLTVDNVHFKKKDISDALDGLDLNNGAGPGGIRPTGVAGGIVFESGRPVSFSENSLYPEHLKALITMLAWEHHRP